MQGVQTSFVAALTGGIGGRQTKDAVSLMDLYATALEVAGATDPGDESVSLLPYLTTPRYLTDRLATSVIRGAVSGGGAESVYVRSANRRWTYIGYRDHKNKIIGEELYDRDEDPGEFTNLATDPSSLIKLGQMRSQTLAALGLGLNASQ